MKSIIRYLVALFSIFCFGTAYCEKWDTLGDSDKKCEIRSDDPCEIVAKTKYGELKIIVVTPGEGHYQVSANGKNLSVLEGDYVEIVKSFSFAKKELVLIGLGSGGMACPFELLVAQFGEGEPVILSKSFGTCSDYYKAYLKGAALIVKSPDYFNPMHMDELDEKEQKEVQKERVVTYKWVDSKLVE